MLLALLTTVLAGGCTFIALTETGTLIERALEPERSMKAGLERRLHADSELQQVITGPVDVRATPPSILVFFVRANEDRWHALTHDEKGAVVHRLGTYVLFTCEEVKKWLQALPLCVGHIVPPGGDPESQPVRASVLIREWDVKPRLIFIPR